MEVALVTVGDELLSGDTVNTNAAWLGQRLHERGVTVERSTTVPDRVGDIARVVNEYLAEYDAVFLGSPKWTLSCPPVNAYLEAADFQGTTVGLFVTFGGFDEERFTQSLADRLRSLGSTVPAKLLVKRDLVDGPQLDEKIDRFVRAVLG